MINLKAIGLVQTPRFDGETTWDQLGKGELKFKESNLVFKNEKIPFKSIEDASLNFENIIFRKVRHLSFHASGKKYLFNITSKIELDIALPIRLNRSEEKSFIGGFTKKTIIILAGIIVLNILTQLISTL